MRLVSLLTTFHGRITRKQWWLGFIIYFVGNLSGAFLLNPEYFTAEELPPPSWPDTLWQLAWLVPLSAITLKRFNDRDWPSWFIVPFVAVYVFFLLAPHFGLPIDPETTGTSRALFWIVAIFMLVVAIDNGFFRGTIGANRHGPDPLPRSTPTA